MRRGVDHRRAFTLLELIIVFTVICVLFALLCAALVKAKPKSKRVGCVGHLKNMTLASKSFAVDNHDLFPWQMATNLSAPKTFEDVLAHCRAMSNELSTPVTLVCPSDIRKPATNWARLSRTNMSYFVCLDLSESRPQAFLAGDRNVTTNDVRIGPGNVTLGSGTIVGWDGSMHRFQGNIAYADGSVQQLSSARLRQEWTNTGISSMTWAVP